MTPREAIDAAELAELETRYRHQAAREFGQARFNAGREAGRREAAQELHRAWKQAAEALDRPSLAEIEVRRWGPGGRRHFADPRPGDFPGLQTEAEAG
jgi:hypothetical protein